MEALTRPKDPELESSVQDTVMRYPLHCGNQASALISGKPYPLVGRVTMDQTLVDLTDATDDLSQW